MSKRFGPVLLSLIANGCTADVPALTRIRDELTAEHRARAGSVCPPEGGPAHPLVLEEVLRRVRTAAPNITVEPGDEAPGTIGVRLAGDEAPGAAVDTLGAVVRELPQIRLRSLSLGTDRWKAALELGPWGGPCEASMEGPIASRRLPAEPFFGSAEGRRLREQIASLQVQLQALARRRSPAPFASRIPRLAEELATLRSLFGAASPVFSEGEYLATPGGARISGALTSSGSQDAFSAALLARYHIAEREGTQVLRATLVRRSQP